MDYQTAMIRMRLGISARTIALLWSVSVAPAMGATATPAVPDPRPDPDACTLVTDLDLEPLLFDGHGGTLDSRSGHPAPGLSTCRWDARPKGQSQSRTATLAFYHLADRSHAKAQLDRQLNKDARPSLAVTPADDDDDVVRPGPVTVMARHGADVAVFDASGAELAVPDRIEPRYLLDALALKAVGATIASPPWVAPGRKAAWTPIADDPPARADWDPPRNVAAATSPIVEFALHLLVMAARHSFLLLPIAIFGSIFLGTGFGSTTARSAWRTTRRWLAPPTIILAVANLIFGSAIADHLLNGFGTSAAATITGTYATSTQYNGHDVVGYEILIRTPGGTIQTRFEDDDFNVYPPHNSTRYPGVDDVFTVRYLKRFPDDFTILVEDGSPWAAGLLCASRRREVSEADSRAAFSRTVRDQEGARELATTAAKAGCP